MWMWMKAFQDSPRHLGDGGLPQKETPAPDVTRNLVCPQMWWAAHGTGLHLLFQQQQDQRRLWTCVNCSRPTGADDQ